MSKNSIARTGIGVSLGLVLAAATLISQVTAEGVENRVIEKPNPVPKSDPSNRPIVGIRSAWPSFIPSNLVNDPEASKSKSKAVFVSEQTIIDSWLKDAKFADLIKSKGIPTDNIASILASGIDPEVFDWGKVGFGPDSIKPIEIADNSSSHPRQVDSSAFVGMTANKVFDLQTRYKFQNEYGLQEYAYAVKSDYSQQLAMAYLPTDPNKNKPIYDSPPDWENVRTASQRFPLELKKSTQVNIGSASFGKIQAQRAKKPKFEVPPDVAKDYDIYLVDLVTTIYDIDIDDVDEMSFHTHCLQEACMAYDLVPIRVFSEQQVETDAKTPAVKAGNIEIGEFFRKSTTYKATTPTITAFGLKEDDFYWQLQEDAIGQGSFIFLAAIAVKKGTKELSLEQFVRIKVSKLLLQSDWAETEKVATTVQLRP